MKKTFTRETINGRQYQFLTLPDSNLFKIEIVNKMGAHVERIIQQLTGRNVYGLSHLVEHLGFRCTKDFTTEELMMALKREGTYNASTDHERINYFFKTTSQRMRTAINLVCNFGLNDLLNLTEEEFQTEKKTVYNEVKRYNDDDQAMFHFAVMPTFCGYSQEDNILGTTESVDALTLEDAKLIKNIFLAYGEHVINITYDPNATPREDIIEAVENELARFQPPVPTSVGHEVNALYQQSLATPRLDTLTVENGAEQVMTALLFDTITPATMLAARIGNNYLADLSPTSLTDFIREKNGLTYGLWLYDDQISYSPYTLFMCDVTKGTEDLMMSLLEQSVDVSVDNFTKEAYIELMDMIRLQRTLAFVDQQKYDRIFWTAMWYPNIIDAAKEEFAANIDLGYLALDDRMASYEDIKQYLELFRTWVKERKYGKLTNLEA